MSVRQVTKSQKGPIGNHISHYLLPILNTFEVDDKTINRLIQKYSESKMAAICSPIKLPSQGFTSRHRKVGPSIVFYPLI